MPIVFKLYHIIEKPDDRDDEKLIGIYSSRENAERAIDRLRSESGFRDYPNDFKIFSHRLDEDGWKSGF